MKLPAALRFTSLFATGLALLSITVSAQEPLNFPAPSPTAKVAQTVGLTEVEIVYARPAMRGRKIFGALVPYDAIWRTGANQSSKISFSGPVVFGGVEVPGGTYALYTVPGSSKWEVILSRNTELWGSYGYVPDQEVARIEAKPIKTAESVESLTLSIDGVDADAATLNIAWERVRVSVPISADTQPVLIPQIEAVMASDAEKKPYFAAAMYLYSKGVMLDQAAEWIGIAAAQQPDAFWLTYRQGLVLEAAGDKVGAIAAAEKSLAKAQTQEGEIKAEYTRLNEQLLARLQQ
ncbi:DUF2911 domain-containing protein [Synoicihabitans lomoniglobus]|uniref:DUF2911 domain-containing protein n=1 Tax=Synoicihabitans lomoniglobus TaxID=2909285 RepID=A0AAE9ZXX5_9BACT|nr:DUF2911 domain-containing protein [Opitutaceae bacterium LMO-M01]WED64598.1 DUF2911 domain-containing protein [Opitutaceae bacterium LMO-M01]